MEFSQEEKITTRHKTKSVTLVLESDYYDGLLMDTIVKGDIHFAICGQEKTQFLKALDALMEKYRI